MHTFIQTPKGHMLTRMEFTLLEIEGTVWLHFNKNSNLGPQKQGKNWLSKR